MMLLLVVVIVLVKMEGVTDFVAIVSSVVFSKFVIYKETVIYLHKYRKVAKVYLGNYFPHDE